MPNIRPYRAGDWSLFIELELETAFISMRTATEEQRLSFRLRWPEQLRNMYQWAEDGPAVPGTLILVIEAEDGTYAGHLWLSEHDDFFTAERKLFVTTVAVRAPYRGEGWGTLLMKRADEEARARGLSTIGLGVEALNAGAINLYRRLGYEVTRMSMERSLR